MEKKKKKTRGDVFRINITPPSTTFPWIKIFLHEYGIKEPGILVSDTVGAIKGKSKEELAKEMGMEIIEYSKVLKAWFKNK